MAYYMLFVVPKSKVEAWRTACEQLPMNTTPSMHFCVSDDECAFDVLIADRHFQNVWTAFGVDGWLNHLRESHPQAPQFMMVFETGGEIEVQQIQGVADAWKLRYGVREVWVSKCSLGSVKRFYLELNRVPPRREREVLVCDLGSLVQTALVRWYWPTTLHPMVPHVLKCADLTTQR